MKSERIITPPQDPARLPYRTDQKAPGIYEPRQIVRTAQKSPWCRNIEF